MNIAFYAPLKPPGHAIPSGDRQMARALTLALQSLGHHVTLASDLRARCATPDPARLAALRVAAAQERTRLDAAFRAQGAPDLWIAYHPYAKSPDLIGPPLAASWGLPYVTIEGAWSQKYASGDWAPFQAEAEVALRAASLHVCMTARDRIGLEECLGPHAPTHMLPPFITALPGVRRAVPRAPGPVRLAAVGMLRPGTKLKSYAFLARALPHILHLDWHMTLIGDGTLRDAIKALFDGIPDERLTWLHGRGVGDVPALLAQADILAWPGHDEAYGISYLDAQAAGLPVVALDSGGVGETVRDGETALLVPGLDHRAYAHALARLIGDAALREKMGAAAHRFVAQGRTLAGAAKILGDALGRVSATAQPKTQPKPQAKAS